jgi:hypothetical protein
MAAQEQEAGQYRSIKPHNSLQRSSGTYSPALQEDTGQHCYAQEDQRGEAACHPRVSHVELA